MTDIPPDDVPKRGPGRPAVRADGRPMTATERQARRRERLVDRKPALDAVIGLALARRELDDLIAGRGGSAADPDLFARYRAIFEAEQVLCLALGVNPVWAHRKATAARFRRADEAAAARNAVTRRIVSE